MLLFFSLDLTLETAYSDALTVQWEELANDTIKSCIVTPYYQDGDDDHGESCMGAYDNSDNPNISNQKFQMFQTTDVQMTLVQRDSSTLPFSRPSSLTSVGNSSTSFAPSIVQVNFNGEKVTRHFNVSNLEKCATYDVCLIVVPLYFDATDPKTHYYVGELDAVKTIPDRELI